MKGSKQEVLFVVKGSGRSEIMSLTTFDTESAQASTRQLDGPDEQQNSTPKRIVDEEEAGRRERKKTTTAGLRGKVT